MFVEFCMRKLQSCSLHSGDRPGLFYLAAESELSVSSIFSRPQVALECELRVRWINNCGQLRHSGRNPLLSLFFFLLLFFLVQIQKCHQYITIPQYWFNKTKQHMFVKKKKKKNPKEKAHLHQRGRRPINRSFKFPLSDRNDTESADEPVDPASEQNHMGPPGQFLTSLDSSGSVELWSGILRF